MQRAFCCPSLLHLALLPQGFVEVENRLLKARIAATMVQFKLRGWTLAFTMAMAQRNNSPKLKKNGGATANEVWAVQMRIQAATESPLLLSGVGPVALEDAVISSIAERQAGVKDNARVKSLLVAEKYKAGQFVFAKEKPGTAAAGVSRGSTGRKLAALMMWKHQGVVIAVSADEMKLHIKWNDSKPVDCGSEVSLHALHANPETFNFEQNHKI